jgi:hypothetical protein
MNIFELLKQLNRIKPDKNYVLMSKEKILKQVRQNEVFEIKTSLNPSRFIFRLGYSLAVTFSAFIIIFGTIVLFKSFAPRLEALNPQAIKAEADAIDFQIQLSKIIYNAKENVSKNILLKKINSKNIEASNTIIENNYPQTSTENQVSIEEVLDILSK